MHGMGLVPNYGIVRGGESAGLHACVRLYLVSVSYAFARRTCGVGGGSRTAQAATGHIVVVRRQKYSGWRTERSSNEECERAAYKL